MYFRILFILFSTTWCSGSPKYVVTIFCSPDIFF
uniref:Uncharacterized protein n=1 Tax=Heterorhabditis bacteriophora TaxID=37862 RepID=A0A1I7WWI9_HETBA